MYDLPYFKEEDKNIILEFIHHHPFAFISGCDENKKPVVTQVPVFIEEKGGGFFLSGHIMRNTDHHKAFEQNPNVLVVFTGPHCYVSATWYTNPFQGSTWNYMSVHAAGKIKFGSQQDLIDVLKKTTLHFEKGNLQSPTYFESLPSEYTQGMMKAIVPFEVEVENLQHIFKLSQNRDEASYDNIIAKLETQDDQARAIASIMKNRKTKVFQS